MPRRIYPHNVTTPSSISPALSGSATRGSHIMGETLDRAYGRRGLLIDDEVVDDEALTLGGVLAHVEEQEVR